MNQKERFNQGKFVDLREGIWYYICIEYGLLLVRQARPFSMSVDCIYWRGSFFLFAGMRLPGIPAAANSSPDAYFNNSKQEKEI